MKMHLITMKAELGKEGVKAIVPSGTVYVTITTADHRTWEGEAELVKVKEDNDDGSEEG